MAKKPKLAICPIHKRTMRKATYQTKIFWFCGEAGCDVRQGAHPDGRPWGIPTDSLTRSLRIKAHALCEQVWHWDDKLQRKAMYEWIQQYFGYKHIRHMDTMDLHALEEHLKKDFPEIFV